MTNGSIATSVSPSDAVIKNQLVTLSATFTVSGTNTVPTNVTVKVKDPSGNTDTYSSSQVTSFSSAVVTLDIAGDEEGIFYWTVYSTGTAQAAASGQFTVLDTPFN